ncbi:hypothetical protein GCM10023196_093200 [Actinoallomurus vinaceus]|uniref:Uncharacterized protein n=1 Tax=Actinoallomurus vinaceus TaxID=1080074 RepID=A0ABP8URP4_9ACTN
MSVSAARDHLFRWFFARLCLYLVIGLLVILALSFENGDGWVSEMRHGIVPWVSIAVISEVFRWLSRRGRASAPNP